MILDHWDLLQAPSSVLIIIIILLNQSSPRGAFFFSPHDVWKTFITAFSCEHSSSGKKKGRWHWGKWKKMNRGSYAKKFHHLLGWGTGLENSAQAYKELHVQRKRFSLGHFIPGEREINDVYNGKKEKKSKLFLLFFRRFFKCTGKCFLILHRRGRLAASSGGALAF